MKRGWPWPAAMAGILGLTIAGNLWLIRVANADPSFAVEERYYQRALAWDDELAQREANARLGWQIRTGVSPIAPGAGAELTAVLTDASGARLAGAAVAVRVVHLARSAQPVATTLRADSSGAYAGRIGLERPGLWEVRYDIRRGDDRFTATQRVETRAGHP